MRFHIKEDAYMTVEATIVIPLMLASFVAMIYMAIYKYDKTLLCQDTYMMAVYAQRYYMDDKDEWLKNSDTKFSEIKKERPYMACDDISMSVSKKTTHVNVASSLDYTAPLSEIGLNFFATIDEEITDEAKISLLDPISIMLTTEDFLGDR